MQRSLFPVRRDVTIQERFERFLQEHPDVYALFKRFAQEMRNAGRSRYGAKGIAERIRWHMATSSGQGAAEFKLNNVFTSRLARKLIDDDPSFADFFETRQLKTE